MSHQSTQQVLQAVSEFNRYFTSANDAEPNARISVPTKEWNALHFMLFSTLSKHAEPSSPLLVRDVAELIGSTVPDVCKALVQLGHGQRSTNAAVHPEEAIAVAKLLAQPAEGGEVPLGAIVNGREHARRLVACWNACEGISTDAIETEGSAVMGWARAASKLLRLRSGHDELQESHQAIKEQRDELLAALRCAIKKAPELITVPVIRSAIENAEGGK